MNIIKAITPAVLLVAVAAAPLPASAQGRDRDRGDRGGRAVERGARDGRRDGGRTEYRREAPRGRADVRGYAVPRREYYAPRSEMRYRGDARYRYDSRYRYEAPRYYGRSYGSYYRPRFERPYYVFRPHTHIGFGLWLGFGVPYPYAYISSPPPVYGYYGGRFSVVPGARVYGGVSFDIAPAYAPIYVDGAYVGVASDFGPYAQPLTLVPGPHRVMISVGGYRPITWNVSVVAGQVIPFHGSMEAY